MLTLTLMMSASLSSLLTLAEMLVQDWDSWRLVEVEVEVVAGTERDSREEVRAGLSLSAGAGGGAGGGVGSCSSLDRNQR